MQSFLTVLIAGGSAFFAVFMLNPEPTPATANYISAELPEITLPDTELPSFLLVAGQPIMLAFDAGAGFQAGLDLPVEGLSRINDERP